MLSRFISMLSECTLSFFKLLSKFGPFTCTEEAQDASEGLKCYMAPYPGEPLLLYIAATVEVVSMVLIVEHQ
jgi:hypothetical protein